jgi:hypothetical protein
MSCSLPSVGDVARRSRNQAHAKPFFQAMNRVAQGRGDKGVSILPTTQNRTGSLLWG